MYLPHLLYPSINGHWGFFHILVIMHNAAMNMGVQISLYDTDFIFSGYTYRVGLLKYVEAKSRMVATMGDVG